MKFAISFVLTVLCIMGSAWAATARVDDSGTFPTKARVDLNWRSISAHFPDATVEAITYLNVRLNTAPWLKRNGHLYMVLPAQPQPITVEWATRGKLLPGKLISGGRALVYVGVIQDAHIEDTWAVRISADGRQLKTPQTLNFYFEIDVD